MTLAPAAEKLYRAEKKVRHDEWLSVKVGWRASRAKDTKRSECVTNVREGRMMARDRVCHCSSGAPMMNQSGVV